MSLCDEWPAVAAGPVVNMSLGLVIAGGSEKFSSASASGESAFEAPVRRATSAGSGREADYFERNISSATRVSPQQQHYSRPAHLGERKQTDVSINGERT